MGRDRLADTVQCEFIIRFYTLKYVRQNRHCSLNDVFCKKLIKLSASFET